LVIYKVYIGEFGAGKITLEKDFLENAIVG
jgi:hypothetical protein